ncbi:MAG: sulfotransferase [Actinobacteria bacterium]|nr:sulfotransferase [Actinomycetota bacterium]
MSAPVLVLAAGQRCGSTLIQRLLSSHPDVLIWGEHAGQLRQLLAVADRLHGWTAEHGEVGRLGYARSGHQSFMANMTPEAGAVDDAVRGFVEALFARPAAAMGRPVWGFKEVRYGLAEAAALRVLFPDCRVVHIVRDPRDILRSLEVWERGGWPRSDTELAVGDWARVGASFWSPGLDLPPWVLRVRYEDLVADPETWRLRIAEHCGLAPELLDARVFDRRIHAVGLGGRVRRTILDFAELPASMRALLDGEQVRRVAAACGYALDEPRAGEPVGSEAVDPASVDPASVGSEQVGSEQVGSEPVGSEPGGR